MRRYRARRGKLNPGRCQLLTGVPQAHDLVRGNQRTPVLEVVAGVDAQGCVRGLILHPIEAKDGEIPNDRAGIEEAANLLGAFVRCPPPAFAGDEVSWGRW